MFKKARKFIKKDLQRRYDRLEDRFLKFETRLYSHLEERMERLEQQFDKLSDLIKERLDEDEEEGTEEPEIAKKEKVQTNENITNKVETLQVLKGLGPALEKKLLEASIYSLEQLAELTADDIDALEEQVPGFKQRYERYNWRKQAKELLEQ